MSWVAVGRLGLLLALAGGTMAQAVSGQPARYRLLATAESDDQVALIEFTPCGESRPPGCGASVVRTYQVGLYPADAEGPHGVVPASDGQSFYVSLAHGRPFGYVQRIHLASGRATGLVEVGMFAATIDRGGGDLLYVVNFNFEDPRMEPSSVSVIDGRSMTEVARTTTCRMPHGSRLDPTGTKHYSGCMMNDLLVEIDARTFAVTHKFRMTPGREGLVAPTTGSGGGDPADSHADHPGDRANACSPTWAQPAASGPSVFVACNRGNEIVEVDVARWAVTRRWKTPAAPYNLAVTPDGTTLVATQKGPGTTTVWRIDDATLLGEVPGTRRVASGVAVSADSRYAFVTLEGIGGDPGTIDVIDLQAVQKVATVAIGKQAGGIAVLR
jgi:DNA-binding beta-propeller fold protein YncE